MNVWVVEVADGTSNRRLRFTDVVEAHDAVAAARKAGFAVNIEKTEGKEKTRERTG